MAKKKNNNDCKHTKTAKAYVRAKDYEQVEYCMECYTEIKPRNKSRR